MDVPMRVSVRASARPRNAAINLKIEAYVPQLPSGPAPCAMSASNTPAKASRMAALTSSMGTAPTPRSATRVTGRSPMPQGTMRLNPFPRSTSTLMATPCMVTQLLTLTPMAATLASSTHTPVSPSMRPASATPSLPRARMTSSSSARTYQCRSLGGWNDAGGLVRLGLGLGLGLGVWREFRWEVVVSTHHRYSLRSRMGYTTSCPGPCQVTSPPRSVRTTRCASASSELKFRLSSVEPVPSVYVLGCSTRSKQSPSGAADDAPIASASAAPDTDAAAARSAAPPSPAPASPSLRRRSSRRSTSSRCSAHTAS
mmetsp:Transcript_14919/g.44995  ORF Transcript_14919/g.44995 Transcript_14919/m.44995 type:complete len:313 (-) Transcript_14919:473-1411(-)